MKRWLAVVFAVAATHSAVVAEEAPSLPPSETQAPLRTGAVVLYDAGGALPAAGAAGCKLEVEKWARISGAAATEVKGDAVLCNQYSAVVVRKDGSGVELYAQAADGWVCRARLAPLEGGSAVKFAGTASVPGDAALTAVTVRTQGAGEGMLEFGLAADSPLLRVTAKGKPDGLRITAPCRFGVLPDFFTDDLVVDAVQVAAPRVEIPAEHQYLQMLDHGNAILAIFCEKSERDIQVGMSGVGDQRSMKETDVFFGKEGGNIWAGTLEHKGIWHSRLFTKEENQKGAALDWCAPFEASWKGNFTLADKEVKSESMNQWIRWPANTLNKGEVKIPGLPGRPKAKFDADGPLLVYPLRRNENTPLTVFLLDDLMRLSLGSGPCAFILDVPGRRSQNKGIFTCNYHSMMKRLTLIDPEDHSVLKEERVMLRQNSRAVLTFMEFIESRIALYVEFRKEMLALLEEREKKNPDLAEFAGKLKELVSSLPQNAPQGSREAAGPALKVVEKAILLDTPAQFAASRKAVGLVPQSAEPQDNLLGKCRRTLKILRARASAEFVRNPAVGKNPAASEIVKAIREKSRAVLHGPASHEGEERW